MNRLLEIDPVCPEYSDDVHTKGCHHFDSEFVTKLGLHRRVDRADRSLSQLLSDPYLPNSVPDGISGRAMGTPADETAPGPEAGGLCAPELAGP